MRVLFDFLLILRVGPAYFPITFEFSKKRIDYSFRFNRIELSQNVASLSVVILECSSILYYRVTNGYALPLACIRSIESLELNGNQELNPNRPERTFCRFLVLFEISNSCTESRQFKFGNSSHKCFILFE